MRRARVRKAGKSKNRSAASRKRRGRKVAVASSTPAVLGGPPARTRPWPRHPIVGPEERRAIKDVLDSGRFSTFIAAPGQGFLGGERIRRFEKLFADVHGVPHAVSVNSATAGLHAAVAAVGVQPGDEVLVPPYTFTSTATSVLMHNAVPVFVDVHPRTFCMDSAKIEQAITPKTRAIIPVHLFGYPADMDPIMEIARKHGLRVIEDVAQAPGALYKGRKTGTIGDCGVFSFQETKNIMVGEGGMVTTSDPEIANVVQMVRNHGEVVLPSEKSRTYTSHLLGWNYRLCELEAALGIVQTRKMDRLNGARIKLAGMLTREFSKIPGFQVPLIEEGRRHVYYVYPLLYDADVTGIPRARFVEAMNAEGIPFAGGYVKPLYLSPLYQERRALAFSLHGGAVSYEKGICPVTEDLHENRLILTPIVRPPAGKKDMQDVIRAVRKVLAGCAGK